MIGFDEAVAYIHDYMINNPPFDVRPPHTGSGRADKQGIMGFSQGACMAAILSSLVCLLRLSAL